MKIWAAISDAVAGWMMILRGEAAAGTGHLGPDERRVEVSSGGDLVLAGVDHALVQPDGRAVLEPREQLRPRLVDHAHPGVDEHLGAQVGVAARDQRPGVDHSDDSCVDEGLCGGAVEVDVVADGDVP